jgi:hypothetical protein
MIPAALILLVAAARRASLATVALLGVAVIGALLLTVPRGDRGYIVWLVLSLIVAAYVMRDRRPRVLTIAAVVAAGILVINVLGAERYKEKRHDPIATAVTAVTHPQDQLKRFITGPDPSLFSVLSLEYSVVPQDVPYDPGKTAASIAAGPVPGRLWHGKPAPPAKNVTDYLFYEQSLVARATNLPSLFGDAYADFGFVAVALEALLLGVGFRFVYAYFSIQRRNAGMQILFAASVPLVFDLLRNTLTDTTGRSVVLVVPLIICVWVCSRPPGALLPRLRHGAWAPAPARPRR